MTATGMTLLLLAITGGIIYSIFNPILLPVTMENAIITFGSSIWSLNGILPITAVMTCIKIDFYILIGLLIWKIFFGAVAGKPEID